MPFKCNQPFENAYVTIMKKAQQVESKAHVTSHLFSVSMKSDFKRIKIHIEIQMFKIKTVVSLI